MHFILMGDLKLIPLNQSLWWFKVLWLPIFYRNVFSFFSHFEKVEYKSVWLAPLVVAHGKVRENTLSYFLSTRSLNTVDNGTFLIFTNHCILLATKKKRKWGFTREGGSENAQDTGKSPNSSYQIIG